MSFIKQLATVNECGAVVNNNTGCTYDAFMTEMLNIENSINEAVNTFNRLINTDAITALLEDSEMSTEVHKNNLLGKLKSAWAKIVEWFFKMLDTVWNYIYEQVVIQSKFIDKHKDDIMRTTVIYKKVKSEIINSDGSKGDKIEISISEPSMNTYSKLLAPNFIEPFMDKSDLKDYIGENNRVDTNKLYNYYKDTILGTMKDIDIDDINSGKGKLIEGIKNRYNDVKSRKSQIISIRKKYQIPPKELTPEAVKEFQSLSMAQVESLKAYNRVTLDYCKASVSILKKFIKNAEKEEK
jgi:hypothetical protein